MIWFLLAAAVLTVAALALLLRPLLNQPRPGVEEAEPVAALFRRQLAAIDEELAEGRIAPPPTGTRIKTPAAIAGAQRRTAGIGPGRGLPSRAKSAAASTVTKLSP